VTPRSANDQTVRRRRRRFAAQLAPLALLLIVAGGLLARRSGVLGAVGATALAQGIGLFVALIWLAAGRNPLSKG
jgi:cytochrome c biogenesis factor